MNGIILISLLSVAVALLSAVIATLSFLRAMAGSLPTIELIVDEDVIGDADYKFLVENPTRRTVLLESIYVLRPDPDGIYIAPDNIDTGGNIERAMAESESSESGYKAVYLAVPAGESRKLSVIIVGEPQGFECKFTWSRNLPMPDRFFMTRKIKISADVLSAMKLAASTRRG